MKRISDFLSGLSLRQKSLFLIGSFGIICLLYFSNIKNIGKPHTAPSTSMLSPTPVDMEIQPVSLNVGSSSSSVSLQSVFSVTLRMKHVSDIIESGKIILQYDPEVLQPLGVIPGTIFPVMPMKKIHHDRIEITVLRNDATLLAEGTIATVQFLAIRKTEGTLLSFGRATTGFTAVNGEIPVQMSNEVVEVIE